MSKLICTFLDEISEQMKNDERVKILDESETKFSEADIICFLKTDKDNLAKTYSLTKFYCGYEILFDIFDNGEVDDLYYKDIIKNYSINRDKFYRRFDEILNEIKEIYENCKIEIN